MNRIYLFPIFFQGLVLFVDEFYFHLKRGLPRWERFGHPLDTFTFLACLLFTLFSQPTQANIFVYVGMSAFSCVFVTKDEFVHAEKCTAGEQWMHSLLFLLHPVSLFCFYRLWIDRDFQDILFLQSGVILSFMIYQIIFWHFFGRRDDVRS